MLQRTTHVTAATAILIAAVAFALWWSGFIPMFGRNRGFLQVTVAIPVTCVAAGLWAGRWTSLGGRALSFAVLPVLVLVVTVALAFDIEATALSGALVLAGTAVGPWLLGVWVGGRVRTGSLDASQEAD